MSLDWSVVHFGGWCTLPTSWGAMLFSINSSFLCICRLFRDWCIDVVHKTGVDLVHIDIFWCDFTHAFLAKGLTHLMKNRSPTLTSGLNKPASCTISELSTQSSEPERTEPRRKRWKLHAPISNVQLVSSLTSKKTFNPIQVPIYLLNSWLSTYKQCWWVYW